MSLFGNGNPVTLCEEASSEVADVRDGVSEAAERVEKEQKKAENEDEADIEGAANEVQREAENGERKLDGMEADLQESAETEDNDLEARRAAQAAKEVHRVRLKLRGLMRVAQSVHDEARRDRADRADLDALRAEIEDVDEELAAAKERVANLASANEDELEPSKVERLESELSDVREELDQLRTEVNQEEVNADTRR